MRRRSNDKDNSYTPFTRLPYFDWDKAKYFYYVAKFLNLSNAARFLNISQPALSKKLTILENHLNCKLFIRKHPGLQLSRKGHELFVIIEKSYLALKGFSYNTSVASHDGEKRKIRISTTRSIASYILSDPLIDYSTKHPDIVFEVIANDQVMDVVLNDVDLAIRPHEENTMGVIQEPLFTLEKRLFASETYIQKYGEPHTVQDLKNHRFIAFENFKDSVYTDIHWILEFGLPFDHLCEPVFVSNTLGCLVNAAKKGIGIIGSYASMTLIQESKLKNILPDIKGKKITWCCAYLDFLKQDECIQDIKNFLQNKLKNM